MWGSYQTSYSIGRMGVLEMNLDLYIASTIIAFLLGFLTGLAIAYAKMMF